MTGCRNPWCGPCAASLPALDQLRTEFPAKSFQVLAINVDSNPELGRKFLMKYPVSYPSAADPKGRLPEEYGVDTMPTAFLIDQKGVIRHVQRGFRNEEIGELRDRITRLVGRRK